MAVMEMVEMLEGVQPQEPEMQPQVLEMQTHEPVLKL
jgi:hypothetical protein